MLKCESLNKVLNKDKTVSYFYFKNDLLNFIKSYMKEININTYLYLPIVNTTNNTKNFGTAEKLNEIEIDEIIFKNIYSGKRLYLLVIFHELVHIKQNSLIKNGIFDKNLFDIIKEDLLDYYFTINSKNLKSKSYFDINYNLDSSEVQASLEAIDLFYTYLDENNINPNLFELYILCDLTKDLKKRLKNKKRKFLCSKLKFYRTINLYKLFDYTIKKNPEWLEWYPCLQIEYYFDEDVVKRIDYQNFDLRTIENESYNYKEYVKYLKENASKRSFLKMIRG